MDFNHSTPTPATSAFFDSLVGKIKQMQIDSLQADPAAQLPFNELVIQKLIVHAESESIGTVNQSVLEDFTNFMNLLFIPVFPIDRNKIGLYLLTSLPPNINHTLQTFLKEEKLQIDSTLKDKKKLQTIVKVLLAAQRACQVNLERLKEDFDVLDSELNRVWGAEIVPVAAVPLPIPPATISKRKYISNHLRVAQFSLAGTFPLLFKLEETLEQVIAEFRAQPINFQAQEDSLKTIMLASQTRVKHYLAETKAALQLWRTVLGRLGVPLCPITAKKFALVATALLPVSCSLAAKLDRLYPGISDPRSLASLEHFKRSVLWLKSLESNESNGEFVAVWHELMKVEPYLYSEAQKVERAAELAREKLKWQKEREEENAQASGSGATPQSRITPSESEPSDRDSRPASAPPTPASLPILKRKLSSRASTSGSNEFEDRLPPSLRKDVEVDAEEEEDSDLEESSQRMFVELMLEEGQEDEMEEEEDLQEESKNEPTSDSRNKGKGREEIVEIDDEDFEEDLIINTSPFSIKRDKVEVEKEIKARLESEAIKIKSKIYGDIAVDITEALDELDELLR